MLQKSKLPFCLLLEISYQQESKRVDTKREQKEEEGSREEVGRVAEDPRVHFLEEGEVVRRKHVDFFDEQSPLPAVQDDFEHPVDAQQARGTLHESLVFGQPDANAF